MRVLHFGPVSRAGRRDQFRGCRASWLACLAVLVASLIGCLIPQVAAAAQPELPSALGPESAEPLAPQSVSPRHLGYSLTPSATEPYLVCPPPTPGHLACVSIIDPPAVKTASGFKVAGVEPLLEGGGEGGGFDPADLQGAYKISSKGGSTQTVAVVDAFDDPNAEADLAKYRAKYGLPECKKENLTKEVTHCFRKVNQKGEEGNYPSDKYPREPGAKIVEDWGVEISLDLDMVSAICPECKILLVEANENATLYQGEEEAEKYEEGGKKVATEISNSWAGEEFSGETLLDKTFENAGVPITFAAGDHGYKVEYPAASKYVVSVGGTTLLKKTGSERGWEEKVWYNSGSGCSEFETKPTWQTDPGCAKRTDNDVAAVSDTASPLSVYDSYEYTVKEGTEEYGTGKLGWINVGGTSAATPLVAGVEAHASSTVRAEGAEAFYNHALFDVPSGTNGQGCRGYLCHGEESYNGPTGWGTPDGPLEISAKYAATTAPAEELKPASAVLAGYVYPGGVEATYHFEYGKTTSYGTNVPTTNASAGSGSVWKGVSQSISGLEWETTYHYRLVAVRGTETKYGQDQTFTTVPWTIQTTPVSSGILEGVSCTSSSACIAVGEDGTSAESWNGTEWKKQTVPVPTGGSTLALNGVSCSSSTACTAVGGYKNSSKVEVTLAERWNGTEWKVEATPNPTGALASHLTGVSCPSSSACTAVGWYENSSKTTMVLAEHWTGTEWAIQSTSSASGGFGTDEISCPSTSICVAAHEVAGGMSVIERWNGSEWNIQTIPTPTHEGHAAAEVKLRGVSCVSPTECTTAGDYRVEGYGYFPLAEHWNGTEWQIQSISSEAGGWSFANLRAISCASALSCTAAGQNNNEEDFAEHWNGAEWHLQTMSEAHGLNYLEGISCVQPEREVCKTVGGVNIFKPLIEGETVPLPFVESKEATSTVETTATLNGAVNPNGAETKYYFEYGTTTSYGSKTAGASAGSGITRVEEAKAISGLTGDTTYHFRIVAVNGSGSAHGVDHTFTTTYKPTVETKPATSVSAAEATLNGTVNPNGAETKYYFEYGKTTSYGTKTAEVNLGAGRSSLEESKTITGLEPGKEYHFRIVATNNDGTSEGADHIFTTTTPSWRIASTPNPSETLNSYLWGVSCTSSTACTAVGQWSPDGNSTDYLLAERWSGTEWQIETTPDPTEAKKRMTLYAVSCASSTECMAVGYYQNSAGVYLSLAEDWNGTEWKIQSTPEPTGTLNSLLYGVSCTSSMACTAVGWYENSSGVEVPWAERWNGTAWSVQTVSAPTGAKATYPYGVSCTSSTACTMAGYYENSSSTDVPFAESWNGTEWSAQSTPSPTGATMTRLQGVSCTSSTACTAAGYYKNSTGTEVPFAERWNGTAWSIQSMPEPSGTKDSYVYGVSCASSTTCTVAGVSLNTSSKDVTFAESWNGTVWSVQATPNESGAENSYLTGGVSCSSATSCAAVGNYHLTLAEIYG